MKIYQHIIPVPVPRFIPPVVGNNLYYNRIPAASLHKFAETVLLLEQTISESVSIHEEIRDYLVCKIRSTIQHEAAHREDESRYHSQVERSNFKDYSRESRVEPIAERAEEQCIMPEVKGGQIENVRINDLFEEAKSEANIDSSWKDDIIAATLPEGIAGQYMMKSMPIEEMIQAQQIGNNVYQYGNKLLIDVRSIVEPFIVDKRAYPANVQTQNDGAITMDPDMAKADADAGSAEAVPAIEAVPSIGVR